MTAYVDIETTGLGDASAITTIVVYDGDTIHHYVNGVNLAAFPRDIRRYAVLVTYNGKCFDVPVIERFFRMQMPQAHIDLRYVLKRLGYAGGLKGCERQLGMARTDLADVDGFFAVLLWDEFQRTKNPKALETLLAYNTTDVLNLETLLVLAYNLHVQDTPSAPATACRCPCSRSCPSRPIARRSTGSNARCPALGGGRAGDEPHPCGCHRTPGRSGAGGRRAARQPHDSAPVAPDPGGSRYRDMTIFLVLIPLLSHWDKTLEVVHHGD
jgi:hypothetical protein